MVTGVLLASVSKGFVDSIDSKGLVDATDGDEVDLNGFDVFFEGREPGSSNGFVEVLGERVLCGL